MKKKREKNVKRSALDKFYVLFVNWIYSTVTDLAKFLGQSTLHPRKTAM